MIENSAELEQPARGTNEVQTQPAPSKPSLSGRALDPGHKELMRGGRIIFPRRQIYAEPGGCQETE